MSYINVPFTVAVGTPLVIPLNRWGRPSYTIQLTSSTAGTMAVTGTLAQVNRGETATFSAIDDIDGSAMATLADPSITQLANVPLEAVTLTATTATLTGVFMQTGSE